MSGRELTDIQKARGLVADAFFAAAGERPLSANEVRAMLLVHNMLDQVHNDLTGSNQKAPLSDPNSSGVLDPDAILRAAEN